MVDLGITFPEGENDPGIDVILPDLRFIEEERADLAGIVLTHAHEDHFGAVIELWPRLQGADLRHAVHRGDAEGQARRVRRQAAAADPRGAARRPLQGRPVRRRADLAWRIRSRRSNALAIRTPLGIVLHTGDWKIDSDADDRRADRRRPARAARRRGRAGAWSAIPPTPCARAARPPSWTWPSSLADIIKRRQAPRGRHDLRLQRRAHQGRGRRRAGAPAGSWWWPAGPCTASSRWRSTPATCRRTSSITTRTSSRTCEPQRGRAAVHRQPGRAARRAGPHRRGRASRRSRSTRATS